MDLAIEDWSYQEYRSMWPRRWQFTMKTMMAAVAAAASLLTVVLLVQKRSEAAQRDGCLNNLRNIALGVTQYATAHDGFPAGTIVNDRLPVERRLSWLVVAAGFLDQW